MLCLSQAVWSSDGEEVVYPCHAIIVSMTVSSGQQRFFIGHTDKVFLANTHTHLNISFKKLQILPRFSGDLQFCMI